MWSKLVDAGLDAGEYTPATKPEVEAARDAAQRASEAQNTKLYEAVVEHLTNVDADAAASAIADVRDMVRPKKNLYRVEWPLFDALLATAVRVIAAARARGDDHRLFSAETLGAALCEFGWRVTSSSLWPFLALLEEGDDRARAVRLKLAGALDGGVDEYTLPSREEVEAKRDDARAAAAAKAPPPPPPPPPAPRGRSTRTKRNPRDGWNRYG